MRKDNVSRNSFFFSCSRYSWSAKCLYIKTQLEKVFPSLMEPICSFFFLFLKKKGKNHFNRAWKLFWNFPFPSKQFFKTCIKHRSNSSSPVATGQNQQSGLWQSRGCLLVTQVTLREWQWTVNATLVLTSADPHPTCPSPISRTNNTSVCPAFLRRLPQTAWADCDLAAAQSCRATWLTHRTVKPGPAVPLTLAPGSQVQH